MSRWPIRVKLTAAFALAMLLMLTCAALFVYLRLRADLDDGVNAQLRARAEALVARQGVTQLEGVVLEDPQEGFAQVISVDGRLLDTAGGADVPALGPAEIRRAESGTVLVERPLPGIDGTARVLARRAGTDAAPVVVAVGQSLVDRDEALGGVVASFAVGGAVAIVLASATGYLLARAGLAPVEAMRRRALKVSLRRADDGLPLPAARDEVRRLGETLNEMLDRLRSSFEREGRFVADASHELRTPVAVIKTELEGVLRTGAYGPQVHDGLLAAVEECDRLAQLAEDLLVLARAADGLPVRPEVVPVRPLLEGVRERFMDRAAQRDRRIRVAAAPDQLVIADPMRVRQALANLVDNALRHGDGEIVLSSRTRSAGIELEVSDEGPGFAPQVAARAFERFARGDQARTGGGAGLGLAIVEAVTQAHGGRVAIAPGAGARVLIWLPERSAQRRRG